MPLYRRFKEVVVLPDMSILLNGFGPLLKFPIVDHNSFLYAFYSK